MGGKAKRNMSIEETAAHHEKFMVLSKFIEKGLGKQHWSSVKFGYIRCAGNTFFIDHVENDIHWTEKSFEEFCNDSCESFDPGFGAQSIRGDFVFYNGDRSQILEYDGNEYWHYTPALDDDAYEDFKRRETKHKECEDIYGLPWYEVNGIGSYQWFRILDFDRERAIRASDNPNGIYDIDPKIAQESYENGYIYREDPNIEGPRAWCTRDYTTLFVQGIGKSSSEKDLGDSE